MFSKEWDARPSSKATYFWIKFKFFLLEQSQDHNIKRIKI